MSSDRQSLPKIFSEININGLKLRNRTLMGSMHLNMGGNGAAYDRMSHFYRVRARGEAGLIVTAGCSPNEQGDAIPNGFCLDDDELVESHRKITQAVHEEGGHIALQILHFGREAFQGKLVSASALRLESNMFRPKALTEEGIWQTIDDHAQAARRAKEAGYDAVELIFSQGFLIHQFLSPHTNRRTDNWGGSLENRIRFGVETAKAVRKAVGSDFPLIFRIPCCDLIEGAFTPDEALVLIERLMPVGIDLLNVSIGWHESQIPTIAMTVPRAAFAPVAKRIKQHFPQTRDRIARA